MLEVDISKILPVTEARDSLNKIIDDVSAGDQMYVLTVNGKPSAVVVGVHHLEKLTGKPTDELMASTASPTGLNEMSVTPSVSPTPIAPVETTPLSTPTPTPAPVDVTPTPSATPIEPTPPTATPAPPVEPVVPAPAPIAPSGAPSNPMPGNTDQFITPANTDLGSSNPTNNTATVSEDLFSN